MIIHSYDYSVTASQNKKPPRFPGAAFEFSEANYFFFAGLAFAARFSSMAACAAARRATGTR